MLSYLGKEKKNVACYQIHKAHFSSQILDNLEVSDYEFGNVKPNLLEMLELIDTAQLLQC